MGMSKNRNIHEAINELFRVEIYIAELSKEALKYRDKTLIKHLKSANKQLIKAYNKLSYVDDMLADAEDYLDQEKNRDGEQTANSHTKDI